jgi:hypothetical protein
MILTKELFFGFFLKGSKTTCITGAPVHNIGKKNSDPKGQSLSAYMPKCIFHSWHILNLESAAHFIPTSPGAHH